MTSILITGGLGYIGSHTVLALVAAGMDVVVVDNLSNSKRSVLDRIQYLAGSKIAFYSIDVRDAGALDKVFSRHAFSGVIHFAGLKAVGESVTEPLRYYENNVYGSLVLFKVMAAHCVHSIVFSSSATVYGDPATVPIREDFPLQPTNPYGQAKWVVEEMLRDMARSDERWRVALLRYFNPVGAHESGLIGEDPNGVPNNLLPYIAQVAIGKREYLSVWGNDYPTLDGTGVRDYIHVLDLAEGHVAALKFLGRKSQSVVTVNLGTGRGYSVLEMVQAFEKASGRSVPYQFASRRPGDIAQCFADPAFAKQRLGWVAQRSIDTMCEDAWRWQLYAKTLTD
ncbi:MAG: UDP-glucose 4-epimerase GalE [Candidatus Pacearchaeota archaeon]|nr:UDP-glucose 4-epimerase GalE [Candidatus Pacearchaeota archaeon]